MPWAPDPAIEQLVDRIISRARDEAVISERNELARLAEEYSARGLSRSGPLLGAQEKATAELLTQVVRRSVEETLALLESIFAKVPAESVDWLRDKFSALITGLATGLIGRVSEARNRLGIDPRGAVEQIRMTAMGLHRDLELTLVPIELRARLAQLTPPQRDATQDVHVGADVFICHASEDKDAVAIPLKEALEARGYTVWLDKFAMKIGDRLLDKIDEGITTSRFGVVILSPAFFNKKWTKRELSGLAAREDAEDRPLILPVRHDISQEELAKRSALLAAILGQHHHRRP